DVLLQEVIKERANGSYCSQLADVSPFGGDGAAQDIGRKLEFKGQHQPCGESQPDPLLDVQHPLYAESGFYQPCKRLDRADSDYQSRACLEPKCDRTHYSFQGLLHKSPWFGVQALACRDSKR